MVLMLPEFQGTPLPYDSDRAAAPSVHVIQQSPLQGIVRLRLVMITFGSAVATA